MVRLGAVVSPGHSGAESLLGRSAKKKEAGGRVPTSSRPCCRSPPAAQDRQLLRGDTTATIEKTSQAKKVHVFLGALPYSVLTPNHDTKSPLVRLAVMEYDIRPHEAYDVTIAALFIVFMLIVIALAFVLH